MLHKSCILRFSHVECIVHSILCQSLKNYLLSDHVLSLKKHIASPSPSCFSKITDQYYLIKFIIDKTTPVLATDPMHILKNFKSIPIFAVFSN